MRCVRGDGRCRRSPGTWSGTARRSGRTCPGRREPGKRKPAGPDRFGPFERYCRLRFEGDPHLWATTLFEEVQGLGYEGAYPSFTRALRKRGLRPSCEACAAAGTPAEFAVIDHPAGEETQWDWVELPDPPPSWGQGKHAHLLVGALSHSGGWRGVLAESGGAAVPRRVAARGLRAAGRGDPPVAVRPHVHGLPSGVRGPDGVVRRGREVLRGRRGRLPVAPRLAQGRGGEGEPLRGAAVVADAARRRDPGAGPGPAGRLVPPDGRRPAAGPGRGADDGRRADGGRAARPAAGGAVPRGPGGHAGWCRRRRWWPGTGTPTPSRPATAGSR